MDKNKTILLSVLSVCITIGFLGYLAAMHSIRISKRTEAYSEYTFCVRSAMEKSKENGKPCSLEDAERVCAKLNNH